MRTSPEYYLNVCFKGSADKRRESYLFRDRRRGGGGQEIEKGRDYRAPCSVREAWCKEPEGEERTAQSSTDAVDETGTGAKRKR